MNSSASTIDFSTKAFIEPVVAIFLVESWAIKPMCSIVNTWSEILKLQTQFEGSASASSIKASRIQTGESTSFIVAKSSLC